MNQKNCKVTINKNGEQFDIDCPCGEKTFLEICEENDIEMDNACGGNGVCTTCLIKVSEGEDALSPHTDNEEMMGFDPDNNTYRLGCQCKPTGNCSVELP
mgnify:CR=1 FL=1